jgi:anti-sigma factor RsiW
MSCRDFLEFLSQYLAGELPAAGRSEFEAHLVECPECVAYLDTFQMTIRLGKIAYTDPEFEWPEEPPEELVHAILAARARGG